MKAIKIIKVKAIEKAKRAGKPFLSFSSSTKHGFNVSLKATEILNLANDDVVGIAYSKDNWYIFKCNRKDIGLPYAYKYKAYGKNIAGRIHCSAILKNLKILNDNGGKTARIYIDQGVDVVEIEGRNYAANKLQFEGIEYSN